MKKSITLGLFVAILAFASYAHATVCSSAGFIGPMISAGFLGITAIPSAFSDGGEIGIGFGGGVPLGGNEFEQNAPNLRGKNVIQGGPLAIQFEADSLVGGNACSFRTLNLLRVSAGYDVLKTEKFIIRPFAGPEYSYPGSLGFGGGVLVRFVPVGWFNVSLEPTVGYLSEGFEHDGGFHFNVGAPIAWMPTRLFGVVARPFLNYALVLDDPLRHVGGTLGVRFSL